MLKFVYKLYFTSFKIKHFDNQWKRILIRVINILIPSYFYLTDLLSSKRLEKKIETEESYIVSLTSFPVRIRKVWLTIETILRQKVKPDKIILWLYREEFEGKENLPKNLIRLEKRGLEIRFCDENLMPNLKYFYTMIENPDANVITIDDDILYPPDLIEKLKHWHEIYPESIIAPITRQIKVLAHKIRPYKEWRYLHINTEPSFLNLTMGVGGSFYPKGSLHPDTFDLDTLKRMSLKTDDLWLKVMSLKCNTGVVSIAGEYPGFFIPVIIKNNISLMSENIHQGMNDIIFKNLMDHFKLPASILVGD